MRAARASDFESELTEIEAETAHAAQARLPEDAQDVVERMLETYRNRNVANGFISEDGCDTGCVCVRECPSLFY